MNTKEEERGSRNVLKASLGGGVVGREKKRPKSLFIYQLRLSASIVQASCLAPSLPVKFC